MVRLEQWWNQEVGPITTYIMLGNAKIAEQKKKNNNQYELIMITFLS